MTIAFVCPSGHPLNAPEALAGKAGKCPKCGSKFLIPTIEEAEAGGEDPDVTPESPVDNGAAGLSSIKSSSKIGPAGAASFNASGNGAKNGGQSAADSAANKAKAKDIFVFLCPNGHRLNGPSSLKGKPGKCPHCGEKFLIPADDDVPPEEHEAPADEQMPTGEIVEEPETVSEEDPIPYEEQIPYDEDHVPYESQQEEDDPAIEEPPVETVSGWQLPPPDQMGGHRLAELFTWLWARRDPSCTIELIMKDGQSYVPDLFAPELSQQSYGVFAVRNDAGKFTMTTLCWENVAKVVAQNLDEVPRDLFE